MVNCSWLWWHRICNYFALTMASLKACSVSSSSSFHFWLSFWQINTLSDIKFCVPVVSVLCRVVFYRLFMHLFMYTFTSILAPQRAAVSPFEYTIAVPLTRVSSPRDMLPKSSQVKQSTTYCLPKSVSIWFVFYKIYVSNLQCQRWSLIHRF